MTRRKRLPPKPEPPPEGMMYFGMEIISVADLEDVCKQTLVFNYDVPDYHNDPSYNWRRPRGKRRTP